MANAPANERRLSDANLTANVALPNNAATVNTNGLDLGQATPYPITEAVWLNITTTAGTGANTKNINIRVMDSADNTTFANVNILGVCSLRVVAADDVFPASAVNIALPPSIKRYVRATALGEAGGLDASAGVMTAKLVF